MDFLVHFDFDIFLYKQLVTETATKIQCRLRAIFSTALHFVKGRQNANNYKFNHGVLILLLIFQVSKQVCAY